MEKENSLTNPSNHASEGNSDSSLIVAGKNDDSPIATEHVETKFETVESENGIIMNTVTRTTTVVTTKTVTEVVEVKQVASPVIFSETTKIENFTAKDPQESDQGDMQQQHRLSKLFPIVLPTTATSNVEGELVPSTASSPAKELASPASPVRSPLPTNTVSAFASRSKSGIGSFSERIKASRDEADLSAMSSPERGLSRKASFESKDIKTLETLLDQANPVEIGSPVTRQYSENELYNMVGMSLTKTFVPKHLTASPSPHLQETEVTKEIIPPQSVSKKNKPQLTISVTDNAEATDKIDSVTASGSGRESLLSPAVKALLPTSTTSASSALPASNWHESEKGADLTTNQLTVILSRMQNRLNDMTLHDEDFVPPPPSPKRVNRLMSGEISVMSDITCSNSEINTPYLTPVSSFHVPSAGSHPGSGGNHQRFSPDKSSPNNPKLSPNKASWSSPARNKPAGASSGLGSTQRRAAPNLVVKEVLTAPPSAAVCRSSAYPKSFPSSQPDLSKRGRSPGGSRAATPSSSVASSSYNGASSVRRGRSKTPVENRNAQAVAAFLARKSRSRERSKSPAITASLQKKSSAGDRSKSPASFPRYRSKSPNVTNRSLTTTPSVTRYQARSKSPAVTGKIPFSNIAARASSRWYTTTGASSYSNERTRARSATPAGRYSFGRSKSPAVTSRQSTFGSNTRQRAATSRNSSASPQKRSSSVPPRIQSSGSPNRRPASPDGRRRGSLFEPTASSLSKQRVTSPRLSRAASSHSMGSGTSFVAGSIVVDAIGSRASLLNSWNLSSGNTPISSPTSRGRSASPLTRANKDHSKTRSSSAGPTARSPRPHNSSGRSTTPTTTGKTFQAPRPWQVKKTTETAERRPNTPNSISATTITTTTLTIPATPNNSRTVSTTRDRSTSRAPHSTTSTAKKTFASTPTPSTKRPKSGQFDSPSAIPHYMTPKTRPSVGSSATAPIVSPPNQKLSQLYERSGEKQAKSASFYASNYASGKMQLTSGSKRSTTATEKARSQSRNRTNSTSTAAASLATNHTAKVVTATSAVGTPAPRDRSRPPTRSPSQLTNHRYDEVEDAISTVVDDQATVKSRQIMTRDHANPVYDIREKAIEELRTPEEDRNSSPRSWFAPPHSLDGDDPPRDDTPAVDRKKSQSLSDEEGRTSGGRDNLSHFAASPRSDGSDVDMKSDKREERLLSPQLSPKQILNTSHTASSKTSTEEAIGSTGLVQGQRSPSISERKPMAVSSSTIAPNSWSGSRGEYSDTVGVEGGEKVLPESSETRDLKSTDNKTSGDDKEVRSESEIAVRSDVPPIDSEETFLRLFPQAKPLPLFADSTAKTASLKNSFSSNASVSTTTTSTTAGNITTKQSYYRPLSNNSAGSGGHNSTSNITSSATNNTFSSYKQKLKRKEKLIFMPSLKHTMQKTIDTVYKVTRMREESKTAMTNIQAILSKSSSMDFDEEDLINYSLPPTPSSSAAHRKSLPSSQSRPVSGSFHHLNSHHFHNAATAAIPTPPNTTVKTPRSSAQKHFYSYKKSLSVKNIQKLLSLATPADFQAGSPQKRLSSSASTSSSVADLFNNQDKEPIGSDNHSVFTYSTIQTTKTLRAATDNASSEQKPLSQLSTSELIEQIHARAREDEEAGGTGWGAEEEEGDSESDEDEEVEVIDDEEDGGHGIDRHISRSYDFQPQRSGREESTTRSEVKKEVVPYVPSHLRPETSTSTAALIQSLMPYMIDSHPSSSNDEEKGGAKDSLEVGTLDDDEGSRLTLSMV